MNKMIPKDGEEVLMHLRKSIFVLRKQMFVFAVAVLSSVLLFTYFYEYPAASVTALIFLLLALLYAFYYFLIWYFDVYTITNMRVLAFSKKNLFNSEFAEVAYPEIISVSYAIKGIAATLFQYGDVTLGLTGGEKVELKNLSTPGVVQETLKNLVDLTKRKISEK
jgi:hypothetical protein